MTHLHDPPDHDPTVTLLRAERDGLLQYRGYSAGNQYDVTVAGDQISVPAERVATMVRTLRRVRQLRDAGMDISIRSADRAEKWVLKIGTTEVIGLLVVNAQSWLDGYVAVWVRAGNQRPSTMADIRALLTAPTDGDRSRFTLLGLMYGVPGRGVSTSQLADAVGWTKKTVVMALKFGVPYPGEKLDQLMAALGHRWQNPVLRTGVQGMHRVPEMPGIARLRLIMESEEAGWVTYVDHADPNEARRLTSYRLAVGSAVYDVPGDELGSWLSGVAYAWQNPLKGGA